MSSIRYSYHVLMKLEYSRKIFEKILNIKFHENPSGGRGAVPCEQADGQTDMTETNSRFSQFCERAHKATRTLQRKGTEF
jgi:hypothetical protein